MLQNETCRTMRSFLLGLVAGLLFLPGAAWAQVGDISDVTWPGWIPSDRVVPIITPQVDYDSSSGAWHYSYVLANGVESRQDILNFMLRFNAPITRSAAPDGWWRMPHFSTAPEAIPGITFHAVLPNTIGDSPNGPAEAQIPPGESLSGFVIVSRYPPGYARTYVQGFAPVPYLPDDWGEKPTNVPHDTTNSQRGWTLGPTRYTTVITEGNRRPAVDGFLGFMNLTEKGTDLRDPAPIALELAVNGETVYPGSLHVELNRVDVTAYFHPGPEDGADLVGVFTLASSPLEPGKNVLVTSVEGLVPGKGKRAKDTDRIVFTVGGGKQKGGPK